MTSKYKTANFTIEQLFNSTTTKNYKMTRKEREREVRKSEILSAAIKLFAEKGYEYTTLDEIAEASEFGKGTLYNYFQSKEDIYLGIIENTINAFHDMLKKVAETTDTFKDFLEQFTKGIFSYCISNQPDFILLVHHRLRTPVNKPFTLPKRLMELHEESEAIHKLKIKNAIKSGELRKFEPEKLIHMYRGMVFTYIYNLISCTDANNFDIDEECEFIMSALFNGILSNK